MKKIVFLSALVAFACAAADSLFDPVNDLGYGTLSLRAQTLSMYRDYEDVGSGYSTTLGLQLDYLSPVWQDLQLGFSYVYVEVPHTAGGRFGEDGEGLLYNGRVNLLNELWIRYNLDALGLEDTFVKVGRQVVDGEVFRADEFRQKKRALEAALLTTRMIPDTVLTLGHASRLSNVWDSDSNGRGVSWEYHDIEDVLGVNDNTDGVTWAEFVNTTIPDLEIAGYEVYAHDIANVAGTRAKYQLFDQTALLGYYRHENDIGRGAGRRSDMYGIAVQQKIAAVTVEPGVISVSGDSLLFTELGTGVNHPLGSSMMIYSGQFNGGADTAYVKATTTIRGTVLYALYNYTVHRRLSYTGQELNIVVKREICDHLSVALKVGVGYRDMEGADNTVGTDSRLFVTYTF